MALSAPARAQRRFRRAAVGLAVVFCVFTVLLLPVVPLSVRESVTAVGLLFAGLVGVASGFRRARITTGAASRPWWLLTIAALVAILGNLWVAATGSDPTDPSLISIVTIAIALILSVVALLLFPVPRRRGAELFVMLLDGLVAGGAFLLIASVLAYSELLESTRTTTADRVTGIAFPALDVLLATVAVLLVVRASRGRPPDARRWWPVGFLLYAAADLSYAVRTAQGTFYFGTLLDLGWIIGYLLLALAAFTPLEHEREVRGTDPLRESVADAAGTTLVFSVLVVATVVQVLFGGQGSLQGVQAALWVLHRRRGRSPADDPHRGQPRLAPRPRAPGRGADRRPAPAGPAERGPGDLRGRRRLRRRPPGPGHLRQPLRRGDAGLRGRRPAGAARARGVPRAGPRTARPSRGRAATSTRRSPTGSSRARRRTTTSAPTGPRSPSRSPPRPCSTRPRSAARSWSSAT